MVGISQSEIDELLSSSASAISEGDKEKEEETEVKAPGVSRPKTYYFQEKKTNRFVFSYQSPVVKREKMLFNPGKDVQQMTGKIVVRTLDNYMNYIRSRG